MNNEVPEAFRKLRLRTIHWPDGGITLQLLYCPDSQKTQNSVPLDEVWLPIYDD